MARNWIQFQKGHSLTQFVEEYGSEDQCMDALFRWRWPNGFVCPRCEHTGYGRVQSRALYQCRGCRYQVSLTAGTILASTRLALRTWFVAMYLMTQTKNGISALELSRQLGVSYNTAWSLEHKLMQVMKERDDTRPLGGSVQLDDAYWGGERRGGKRGRGAPGKTPFVAAVELNPKGRPVRMRLSRIGAFSKRRDCRLGQVSPRAWHGRVLRRLGLLSRGAACRLLSSTVYDRRRTGQRETSGVVLGQHTLGQPQAFDAWQLSPRQLQAPAAVSRRILLSVQPPVLAPRDVPTARLCRLTHPAHAQPSPQAG